MFEVNNTAVKKILLNGTSLHKMEVNRIAVFDDQCYVDWLVKYQSAGGGRATTFGTSLTASVTRVDGYPASDVKIRVVCQDAAGNYRTTYYDMPIDSAVVSQGGASAGFYGDLKVWVYLGETLLSSWDYTAHSEFNYTYTYNGRTYFYE